MGYTWEKNEDVEWWQHDEFSTVEECVADAKKKDFKAGDTIVVGIVERYAIRVDAEDILEALEEDAYEQCGEYVESWNPTGNNRKEKEKLSEDITKIVKDWLEKHNDMPGFYNIHGVRTVEIN